jgi:hypothetical protein
MSDIIHINTNTGEITSREYTQSEKDYNRYLEENLVVPEPIVDNSVEIRASALAKLMSLGLTEEEARVIAGV